MSWGRVQGDLHSPFCLSMTRGRPKYCSYSEPYHTKSSSSGIMLRVALWGVAELLEREAF